eukprot:2637352-Pyramimonas_sp.AAC.1
MPDQVKRGTQRLRSRRNAGRSLAGAPISFQLVARRVRESDCLPFSLPFRCALRTSHNRMLTVFTSPGRRAVLRT